mmetsp:Transcript_50685/g.99084  ORF Transcript_50685/g.99084 Transcript_50685/m.99084 type:complete len:97 (-) Transcript_50685:19-309(-)|eukprot:CAMPEP_0194324790 /NCGR_PEP_ID=MMETSP0171-20130528/28865_1 /TAXON_ID=218684 /ORGANISM="Corethron pennatum, Strain L29A3" /LENGTH=96 /DNA_ID=CAMNT_0039083773 /DNA_START=34 /DNA_END=324 /DNA_ORIENTATION=-
MTSADSASRSILGGTAGSADKNEVLEIICELSSLLGTGLDQTALIAAINLIESGIDPVVLANFVKDIRREKKKQTRKDSAEDITGSKVSFSWDNKC